MAIKTKIFVTCDSCPREFGPFLNKAEIDACKGLIRFELEGGKYLLCSECYQHAMFNMPKLYNRVRFNLTHSPREAIVEEGAQYIANWNYGAWQNAEYPDTKEYIEGLPVIKSFASNDAIYSYVTDELRHSKRHWNEAITAYYEENIERDSYKETKTKRLIAAIKARASEILIEKQNNYRELRKMQAERGASSN